MKSGEEKEERSLLGLWPGGECSRSGARQGGRSHCWPAPGGAAQLFLPPQPAGRAPVTRPCCPLSSQAWLDSLRTGPCSALALEGRQQRLLSRKEKGEVKNKTKQNKRNKSAGTWLSQQCCPCLLGYCGLCNPVTPHSTVFKSEGMQPGHKNRERHLLA